MQPSQLPTYNSDPPTVWSVHVFYLKIIYQQTQQWYYSIISILLQVIQQRVHVRGSPCIRYPCTPEFRFRFHRPYPYYPLTFIPVLYYIILLPTHPKPGRIPFLIRVYTPVSRIKRNCIILRNAFFGWEII